MRYPLIQTARIIPKSDLRKTWQVRLDRIKKEGSEYFSWNYPATAAGVTAQIEIANEFPRSRKYQPLDFIEVVNNESSIDLMLIINGVDQLIVPASTIRSVDNTALWQIGLTNLHASSTTTLNNVRVSLRRQPVTIDDWARRGA